MRLFLLLSLGGGTVFFAVVARARCFFAVVAGARFVFEAVAGARFLFAVVAGVVVHSLTGFLGSRTDSKNQHKATTANPQNTGSSTKPSKI